MGISLLKILRAPRSTPNSAPWTYMETDSRRDIDVLVPTPPSDVDLNYADFGVVLRRVLSRDHVALQADVEILRHPLRAGHLGVVRPARLVFGCSPQIILDAMDSGISTAVVYVQIP